MVLWVCAGCSTRFAVGLPACPHCRHRRSFEEGQGDMPKITAHGGPSNADAEATGPEVAAVEPETEPEPTTDAEAEDRAPDAGDGSKQEAEPAPDVEVDAPAAEPVEDVPAAVEPDAEPAKATSTRKRR